MIAMTMTHVMNVRLDITRKTFQDDSAASPEVCSMGHRDPNSIKVSSFKLGLNALSRMIAREAILDCPVPDLWCQVGGQYRPAPQPAAALPPKIMALARRFFDNLSGEVRLFAGVRRKRARQPFIASRLKIAEIELSRARSGQLTPKPSFARNDNGRS